MKNSQLKKKKYRVSKFYAGTYICALILLLMCVPMFAAFCRVTEGGMHIALRIFEVACILDFLFFFKLTFFDFPFAKFEYDDKSMTMYVGTKNYTLLWEDCVDFGLLDLEVELGANTYWVYCSTEYLSIAQKQRFFKKERKNYSKHLFFQYRKELFDDFCNNLPEQWSKKLKAEESMLQLGLRERLFNK